MNNNSSIRTLNAISKCEMRKVLFGAYSGKNKYIPSGSKTAELNSIALSKHIQTTELVEYLQKKFRGVIKKSVIFCENSPKNMYCNISLLGRVRYILRGKYGF